MREKTKSVSRPALKPRFAYEHSLGPVHRRRVLSTSPFVSDHQALRSALNDQIWQVEEAANYQQAIACLCCERIDVVVCEAHLPDGTWKDLLGHIAAIPDPPVLIVSSALVDGSLCTEVRSLGGYAVLAKPFACEDTQQKLTAAWQMRTAGTGVMLR